MSDPPAEVFEDPPAVIGVEWATPALSGRSTEAICERLEAVFKEVRALRLAIEGLGKP